MMTLTHMRCPYCHGKNVEAQRTYTIQCGEPRTLYHCAPCARTFSETRHTPLAQLKHHCPRGASPGSADGGGRHQRGDTSLWRE